MFGEKKKLVMCQACRALVDPAEKTCPMCGHESVPEPRISLAGESGRFFSMLIIGINILIFIMMGVVGMKNGRGMESFVASADGAVLVDFGSFNLFLVSQGEWWRFVTANFLHIGLMHLLFNSYALFQVGPLVEEIYGEQKFLFIYIFTGIFCLIPSYYAGIGGAGASGAISGLIGLMAAYGYRQGGAFGKALMKSMLTWMGMTIVFGFFIGANNVAHAGGFLAGGALGFLLKAEPVGTIRARSFWNALALISIVIFAVSFTMVGRHYGSVQEKTVTEPVRFKQAQNVIDLHRAVERAKKVLNAASEVSDKKDFNDVAKNLRTVAADIAKIGQIDEPSDEIRKRIIAMLNQRADKLEGAARNPSEPVTVSNEGWAQTEAAFQEHKAWEQSVLSKYGLVYTGEQE
jgi:rhomboid protease GluP